MRRAWHMRFMQTIIKKEWRVSVFSNKVLYLAYKIISHIFVFPTGFLPTFHITDTGYSIYNRIIMSVRPLHFQHFGIGYSSRLPLKVLFITHLNRIWRITTYHIPIFYINSRNAVICCRNQTRVIKANLFCSRLDCLIPIDISISHAQMPFSDSSGHITTLSHHLW